MYLCSAENMRVFLLFIIQLYSVWCAPSTESWVTATSELASSEKNSKNDSRNVPKVYSMRVDTNVTNRFATSLVTSKVKNLDTHPQEATFSVILPETAYITGFTMEIDGKKYDAYIQEKNEAKKTYDQAVSRGQAAGHVAVSARDSNKFTVSVNIMPESKATFFLKYQELLSRQKGLYDIVVNLHPGQPVEDVTVQVNINETRPLATVSTPSLRTGNEISKNEIVDSKAKIEYIGDKAATVIFKPDVKEQKEFAKELGTDENNGFAGQFIVQYDVQRDTEGGELLFADGYFIHFFAPKDVKPEPKQISFVLDTSGSMMYEKIRQLKAAMKSILEELKPEDSFNIIDFNSLVNIWNVPDAKVNYQEGERYRYLEKSNFDRENQVMPNSFEVSETNIKKAKEIVDSLAASGGTNIELALKTALKLHSHNKEKDKRQPLIMFLTDGHSNEGETRSDFIISKVLEENPDQIPIISLSFGDGADRKMLEKLSLRNQGFSRHIYEAADADIQLKSFFEIISSPLFNKIKFTYASENVTELTKTEFPIFFNGSELVVAGKYVTPALDPGFAPGRSKIFEDEPIVICHFGPISREFKPKPSRPIGSLEKHWAYLTLKQILKEREISDNKEDLTKKALDLALKYSFVTPVSSLVVVKPNETSSDSNIQDASKTVSESSFGHRSSYIPAGQSFVPYASFPIPGYPAPRLPQVISYQNTLRTPSPHRGTSVTLPILSNKPDLTISSTTSDMEATSNIKFLSSATTKVITEKEATVESLKLELPWFEKEYNPDNDTISLPQGNFLLGSRGQVAEPYPECPRTSTNGTGHCVLLETCPQMYPHINDILTYVSKYFCPLGRYAGVCCPKGP